MDQNALLVLLIEDDMDLAATVSDHLALENIECDFAFNGPAGLNSALTNRFDLILLDLALPKLDGLSICQQLRNNDITTPILMITARDAVSDRVAGFESGADDYLIKPFAFPELAARIRALVRRATGHSSTITIGDLEINLRQKKATRAGRKLNLSPTGWILLEQLARNSPNISTKAELERAIWGDQVPESNTLKVHLYKLRRQIQRPYETHLLHTVTGIGFTLRP